MSGVHGRLHGCLAAAQTHDSFCFKSSKYLLRGGTCNDTHVLGAKLMTPSSMKHHDSSYEVLWVMQGFEHPWKL